LPDKVTRITSLRAKDFYNSLLLLLATMDPLNFDSSSFCGALYDKSPAPFKADFLKADTWEYERV
jgi:hypothetical protein